MRLQATIKAPQGQADGLKAQLSALGITEIEERIVPYRQFVEESRMNYDCVYQEAWDEGRDVLYLRFAFEDSNEGRDQAHRAEYFLKQIPLNLRYE